MPIRNPGLQGSGRKGMGSTLFTGLRLYAQHLVEDTAGLVPAFASLGAVLTLRRHPSLPHPPAVGAIQVRVALLNACLHTHTHPRPKQLSVT
jgi:hypothetical protein